MSNKTIGFTAGAWDLLHPGHLLFLRACKGNCDILVVGLHTDPTIDRPSKNKPVQTVYERYVQLESCKFVDQIVPYETEADLSLILKTKSIDKRFLGTDYLGKDFTDKGSKLYENFFITRDHNLSSTELRNRIKTS